MPLACNIDVIQAVVGHTRLESLTLNSCLQRIYIIYTENFSSRRKYISFVLAASCLQQLSTIWQRYNKKSKGVSFMKHLA